VNYLLNIYIYI